MTTVEQIRQELSAGKSITEVCEKHNKSFNQLFNLLKKDSLGEPERYICKRNHKYYVSKWIDGEHVYFGVHDTLKEAIESRDELIANNWELPFPEYIGSRNIVKRKKGYMIQKRIGKDNKYVGMFASKNDAIKVRDMLIECGWNFNHLKEICEKTEVKIHGY